MDDDTTRRKVARIGWDWRDDGLPPDMMYVLWDDGTETTYVGERLHELDVRCAAEGAVRAAIEGRVN